jgi:hypothetical protein
LVEGGNAIAEAAVPLCLCICTYPVAPGQLVSHTCSCSGRVGHLLCCWSPALCAVTRRMLSCSAFTTCTHGHLGTSACQLCWTPLAPGMFSLCSCGCWIQVTCHEGQSCVILPGVGLSVFTL